MFAHVTIRTAHEVASRRFFGTVLGAIGHPAAADGPGHPAWGDLRVVPAREPGSATTRLHVGFAAADLEAMRTFWQAGVGAGYRSDGEPGPRPEYGPDYHGAFLLDPDGNSIEAVVHGSVRPAGRVDHLWIRTGDRAAGREFYDAVGEAAGFRQVADLADRTRYSPGRGRGSFSIVDGVPTSPFGMAFAVGGREAVIAFHRDALRAGASEAWPPGERDEAFSTAVLDPDGNTIEAICRGG